MAKHNFQKSATCGTTREQYVTRGSENGAVVYDNFMGFPYQVSFLGGQWWVTMPGEPLQPLNDLLDDDISYNYQWNNGYKEFIPQGQKPSNRTMLKQLGNSTFYRQEILNNQYNQK